MPASTETQLAGVDCKYYSKNFLFVLFFKGNAFIPNFQEK